MINIGREGEFASFLYVIHRTQLSWRGIQGHDSMSYKTSSGKIAWSRDDFKSAFLELQSLENLTVVLAALPLRRLPHAKRCEHSNAHFPVRGLCDTLRYEVYQNWNVGLIQYPAGYPKILQSQSKTARSFMKMGQMYLQQDCRFPREISWPMWSRYRIALGFQQVFWW